MYPPTLGLGLELELGFGLGVGFGVGLWLTWAGNILRYWSEGGLLWPCGLRPVSSDSKNA